MATNITWHDGSVSLEERQGLLKQKVRKNTQFRSCDMKD